MTGLAFNVTTPSVLVGDGVVTPPPPPPAGDALLLEDGDALLIESNDRLLLED